MSEKGSHSRQKGPTPLGKLLLLLFGIALVPAGGYLIWDFVIASQSLSWPKAEATILASDAIKEVTTKGDRYKIKIKYSFLVDGKSYTSDSFNTRNNNLSGAEEARAVANKYTYHSKWPVFYNPSNPEQCFLEPGRTWHAWGKLGLGILMIPFGLFTVYQLYRGWNQPDRQAVGEGAVDDKAKERESIVEDEAGR
jgi:hypothetical protein